MEAGSKETFLACRCADCTAIALFVSLLHYVPVTHCVSIRLLVGLGCPSLFLPLDFYTQLLLKVLINWTMLLQKQLGILLLDSQLECVCVCWCVADPGAVVETHSAVPYPVIGGVLAVLVFTIICVLIVTIWCSVRQKGKPA